MGNSENYYWYKSHGICVNCGHDNAYAGHILCLACMMKKRESALQAYYKTRTPEKKAYCRDKAISVYYKRKTNSLCVSCGKRKPVKNETMCAICKSKRRLQRRKKTL